MRFLYAILALALLAYVNATTVIETTVDGDQTLIEVAGGWDGWSAARSENVKVAGSVPASAFTSFSQRHVANDIGQGETLVYFYGKPVAANEAAYLAGPQYHYRYFGSHKSYDEVSDETILANPAATAADILQAWWTQLAEITSLAVLSPFQYEGGTNGYGRLLKRLDLATPPYVNGWPTDSSATEYSYIIVGITTDQGHGISSEIITDGGGSGSGDPQFVGLQGQDFQFHGMADEVFSLISSPELQMNSLFKFISSGNCQYNNTACWSHPGTYLGQIGIQFGQDTKVLLQSGSHSAGMKVYVNDKEIQPSTHVHRYVAGSNSTASLVLKNTNEVIFASDKLYFRIVNSDYFFNLDFGLKDSSIIKAGSKKMEITGATCEVEFAKHKTDKTVIKQKLSAAYPSYPLHGLIGQTWRNAIYCGRYYEGTVDDYVTSGLFANEHTFNNFKL